MKNRGYQSKLIDEGEARLEASENGRGDSVGKKWVRQMRYLTAKAADGRGVRVLRRGAT